METHTDYAPTCARCDSPTLPDLIRHMEYGGLEQCSNCGLALPTPPPEWLRANGYAPVEAADQPPAYLLGLTYTVPPPCQGQMIEDAYASLGDGRVVRRTRDRSDGTTEYRVADLGGAPWQPHNEEPSGLDWEAVS